jgi:hypothetical protein
LSACAIALVVPKDLDATNHGGISGQSEYEHDFLFGFSQQCIHSGSEFLLALLDLYVCAAEQY